MWGVWLFAAGVLLMAAAAGGVAWIEEGER